jgi:hypothetical protein
MSSKKKSPEEDAPGTKVKDETRDHIYFTVTPRLVWALSSDPFDLALWVVIKDIAGERGECILAREDLAALAMMSAGQVTISRDRLLSRGLLKGEMRRDPGYPQEVWHLSIPDFWEANVRWALMYPTIRARVEYKKEQKRIKELEKQRAKDPSLHDDSPEPSPHDEGIPPHDGGIPPHDAKKNVFKKPKEETSIKELRDLFIEVAGIVFAGNDGRLLEEIQRELSKVEISLGNNSFDVSGLGSRAEYYESRYKSSFERAFIGVIGEAVSINFQPSGEVSSQN